jgi:hypothetical protein
MSRLMLVTGDRDVDLHAGHGCEDRHVLLGRKPPINTGAACSWRWRSAPRNHSDVSGCHWTVGRDGIVNYALRMEEKCDDI